jgi:hypothetical protein
VVYANDDPVVLAHAHTLRKSTPDGSFYGAIGRKP